MKIFASIFLMLSITMSSCFIIENEYVDEIESERLKKDSSFLIEDSSPLSPEQIVSFDGLKYFPIDQNYVLEARLERLNGDEIIQLKTSTERLPDYRIFGYVYFDLEGEAHKLTAYQSIKLQDDSIYRNFLFLPFTDDNSTILTYGGGRYIDFEIPESESFELDFNKAYNPYCAYNHKWSCVIPPRENSLKTAIDAGEKLYNNEH